LLDDTQPDEPKALIEEKLKKVTTERAPVAGANNQRGGAGGRAGGPGRSILEGLVDPSRGSTGNPVVDQLIRNSQARGLGGLMDLPSTPGAGDVSGSGAAAAAGVLTAVDEDGEGDEEADVPGEFDYYTDGASDDEDDETVGSRK
jgi:26S proteasome regulatory subunit N2